MNMNDYRRAMDRISPDPDLKERIMSQKNTKRKYLSPRRVVNGLLAAALAAVCLFTVALAASPELRMAVLSFFNTRLVLTSALCISLGFALVYGISYLMTAKTYYKIVKM